jgi:ferredoxin
MKVQVDSTVCAAYGECADVAPRVFQLDDFGYAMAVGTGDVPPEESAAAEQAIKVCPAKAIRMLTD